MAKELFFDKAKAEEIGAIYGTPFYVYDEEGIRKAARGLKKAFSWNKNFKEYYAVKACANPFILEILKEEGCGADCSSYTELMMAEAVGFSGKEIMFSSNVTPAADFEYARKLGAYINLDDITMIDFLKEHGGIPGTVCVRYNPGGDFKLGNAIMGTPGESKYGMTGEQIFEAVSKLKALGVNKFGIHAFLASNTTEKTYYASLAEILFKLITEVTEKTGAVFEFVNLSGGIGIPYRPEEKEADIEYIGSSVREKYEKVLKGTPNYGCAIYTELGRYMTGPYGVLVARAIHEKNIYKQYIGLDACAANLMRPAMYGAYHHITVLGKEKERCDHKYDITGGLCENNDKFAIDRMLPQIDIGDLLAIHDAGAHGFVMGYNYNGKLHCPEILLKKDGSFKLIRRAETPDDYFATFDFTDFFKKK